MNSFYTGDDILYSASDDGCLRVWNLEELGLEGLAEIAMVAKKNTSGKTHMSWSPMKQKK